MERRAVRVLAWIAVGIPVLMDAVYLSLIRIQPEQAPDVFTVPFVASYLLLMAILLAASLLIRMNPVLRGALRAGAGAGLTVLGILAAISMIGLPILLSGWLALVAFGLSIARWRIALPIGLVAGFAAVALLIGGFEVTQRVIVCPASGEAGGSGSGFISGPYSWTCVNGKLTWKSGT